MGIYKKDGNWYIDYYVMGRRQREKIGTNRRLAKTVLHKRKVEIAENKFLDIRKQKKVKFEEFAKTFLELHSKPNKKSWKSDYYNLQNLTPIFAGRYLYSITQKDIEEYKAKRKESGVSAATVNRDLATLKTMFNKAVQWETLEENPAKNVRFFKENNTRLRYLEKEEIKKLIESSSKRLRPILILALNTGMRRGEVFNLKWHDIDFQKGLIYLYNTKNNDKRVIPLNNVARKALISVSKHPDSPYVFCNKEGRPYHDVRKSFFAALEKCGIIDFHFHDLRHTFASQLVMSGVDLNTVRELMGHRDIKMTLRYAHLSPDHKRRAVEILERQMDTIWTPKGFLKKEEKSQDLQHIAI